MPSSLIQHEDGVCVGLNDGRDFFEMGLHGIGVGIGHDQGGSNAPLGADGSENVGPFRALIVDGPWAGTAQGPPAGDLVLLPDPRFVLEPYFYPASRFTPDFFQDGGEVFLNASMVSGSCL